MNNFQTILVAIFLAFFVFAVLIFSGAINMDGKKGQSLVSGKVVIWGTIPSSQISMLIQNIINDDSASIKYVEQDKDKYQNNLIEAFAKDQGPDLFILTPDMVIRNNNFIYKIPYETYPEKSFKDLFVDGADIYLAKDGITGYPLLVDPLVLYYNKDMLSNEGILFPPKFWDELFDLNDKLTKKKIDGSISQSMIALGQYDNVNHSKDILSMLLLQSNNPIVAKTDKGYRLAIKDSSVNGDSPFNQIVNFFLEFSNPSNNSYSWNRSMSNSLDMFTSGRLAFYIGYASELFNIESINPNLSFDVTMIPQTKGVDIKRTYGEFYTIVANNKSKNLASSLGVMAMATDPVFLKELGITTSLPTATRTLLNEKQKDSYLSTFFEGAIVSRSWLDPNQKETNSIFKELIENSLSNKLSVGEAISKASNQLDLILKNNYE